MKLLYNTNTYSVLILYNTAEDFRKSRICFSADFYSKPQKILGDLPGDRQCEDIKPETKMFSFYVHYPV